MAEVEDVVNLSEKVFDNVNQTTTKTSTPEGIAIAYGSLVVMAVLPIFFGAFRSVKHHTEQKVS